MGWIRIRMDPELLPGSGSGKFRAGSGSGIDHFGSTTLLFCDRIRKICQSHILYTRQFCSPPLVGFLYLDHDAILHDGRLGGEVRRGLECTVEDHK